MADNPAFTATVGTLPIGTVAGLMQEDVTGAYVARGVTVFQTGGSTGAWTFTAAAAGAGAVTAGTTRVTLGSDDPLVAAVGAKADSSASSDTGTFSLIALFKRLLEKFTAQLPAALTGSGNLKTAIQEALPAGTNAIGKLAANSGVDIGDVDVTSVVPGTGVTSLGKAEDEPHSSGDVGVFMLAVRKDSATQLADTDGDYAPVIVDANGRVHVAVGNTVTVTGTVAVTQSTAANLNCTEASSAAVKAAVEIMDDWDESDRCKVNPIVGQAGVAAGAGAVGATVQRVTLASDDPVVTAIQIMDDWDDGSDRCRVVGAAAEDAALAGNPVRQGIRASAAVPTAMSADGDAVTPWADLSGRQVVKQQSGTATTSQVADNAASTTLLAANTARLGASIQNDSSAVLYLKCGTTASATDYTARLVQYSYWEAPYGYTGRIDGIWSSDPGDGAARVTEYT